MLIHVTIAALLLQGGSSSSEQPWLAASPLPATAYKPSNSSTAVIDAAGYAVLRFLTTWRTAWIQSASWGAYSHAEIRLRDVHCHWDGSYGSRGYRQTGGNGRPPSLIHHASRRSMCPNWIPTEERAPYDETFQRDASLSPDWRDRIRSARTVLIDSLSMLDARKPGDAWITGQRVRFLVDQGETSGAIDVARRCTADRAYCARLTGYAFYAAGEYARADSAFDAAAAALAPKERCEWTSAQLLFEDDDRSAYEHVKCDDRPAVNEKLWWLTTPLFSDSSDDRRAADFARKVLVELHSALFWDERYDWRSRFGGEAVSEMMIRYGWPAYAAFGGVLEERDHASWMTFYDSTRTATAEYPQDRLHLIPAWGAVADPFHAPASAWQINMPRLKADEEPAAQWWPAEHYARARGGIIQMSDQTVMLRRDSDVLLATASDTRDGGRALSGEATGSFLIRTTAPHKIEKIPHLTFRNANTVVITASIPATPAIVGTELPALQPGELSARTRFGIVPPAPLEALRPGDRAVSDPVLISVEDAAPPGPEGALKRMLGSTRVRGSKVGVYWETYGYAPGDSVDVAVTISRREPLSKMRRIGMFLRVAHDINGSVAVRWGEPQAGHDSWSIPGVVPIQARSIRVDLSNLEPGRYNIQVSVGRLGGTAVTSSRDFVLEK